VKCPCCLVVTGLRVVGCSGAYRHEFLGLVTPGVPSRAALAREEFKVRPSDKPLYALVDAIGLAGVLAPWAMMP